MKTEIKLRFISDPRLLEAVRALVRQYLIRLELPPDRIQDVVLAVDEACTNAIRHAYHGKNDGEITLQLRKGAGLLEIIVSDKGSSMPGVVLQRNDTDVSRDKLPQPGGLGLKLMYCVFSEVHIAPGKKQGNRVRLRLRTEFNR